LTERTLSYLEQEIREQPAVLARLLELERPRVETIVRDIRRREIKYLCLEDALVIGVSQSGRSTDIVEVLKEARRQGACTLAIANDADSPLAQTAEHVILSCGDQGVTRGRPWSD